ncbi:MAG: glycoside hydrolase family 13 protein [Blautia sp.]
MSQQNFNPIMTQEYILQMRPVFNKDALFSDGSKYYRIPMEPEAGEEVKIRFRTLRNNVDSVYLVCGHKRIQMHVSSAEKGFDYYMGKATLGEEEFRYHFEIHSGQLTCYYDQQGVCLELREENAFVIRPGFRTPDWAKGAVFYQIYVDRFCNGDEENDVQTREYYYIGDYSVGVKDWNKLPAMMGVREFYGGDLQGIREKLDYLQDLGVDVIYLNPILVSPSNHKYDCQDYDYVDPHYGRIVNDGGECLQEGDHENIRATKYIQRVTDRGNLEASNRMLAELVEEIHARGMRIVLDGVFNHCGSFNKWMDRERIYEGREGYPPGAYTSSDSPYRSYFKFFDESQWPYNGSYDGWWGFDTLPKLNYENSPQLYQYILDIGKKWVSPPYNTDGWRLDVAADLGYSNEFNHQFWKDFRKAVKEANPQAIILAEHYGDSRGWLRGDEWDTVMNYDAFMEPVTWFLTGMEKHSDEYRQDLLGNSEAFIGAMKTHMSNFHTGSLQTAMNELSNHDHSRFLTRTNRKVGRVQNLGHQAAEEGVNPAVMREAVVIQMTWPGAPTIYYGDEVGVCGFTDPDNRRTYPWGRENRELLEFHKSMIRIHKKYESLKSGSLLFLQNGYQTLSYGRFSFDEQIVVAVNNDEREQEVEIPVWNVGVPRFHKVEMRQLILTTRDGFTEETRVHQATAGMLRLQLPAQSAIVLCHRD